MTKASRRPARSGHASATIEVAMRGSPAEDLYITLGNYDLGDGIAMVKLVVNPLVNWTWLGFMLMAFGNRVALLPQSVLDRLAIRVPRTADLGPTGA